MNSTGPPTAIVPGSLTFPAGWTGSVVGNELTASGPLAVGGPVLFIRYSVQIADPYPDTGDHRLENRASTPPGQGGNCTSDATDPDCDAVVLVREFTVEKTVNPEITQIGDTVTYEIVVTNIGQVAYDGLTPATSAGFADDLSEVLDDADFGSIIFGPATFDDLQTLSWSGALPIGGTVIVRYTVTATGGGEHVLTNGVQPVGVGGNCVTAADCTTEVLIRSYEYEKSASPAIAVEGGVVTYTVVVRNTGAVAYTAGSPAGLTDDLSGVLDDTGPLSAITVTPNVGTASVAGNVLTWSGPLALPGEAGDTVTLTYSVTVDDPNLGNDLLVNSITSTPGTGGSCVDVGACDTVTPVRGYVVSKTATPTSSTPGGTVDYTITVANTGAVAYTVGNPASFVDDLSDVLDDTGSPSAITVTPDTGTASFANGVLTWSGPLAVGGTATITYSVTVANPMSGDGLLTNVVTPTGPGGECDDCTTTTPVQAFEIIKTASLTQAKPGDTIEYTLTVRNIGQVAYVAPAGASFVDLLSDVVDDTTGAPFGLSPGAVYDADGPTGTEGPTIVWTGDLPIGGIEIVRYSFTVADPATSGGNAVLANVVRGGQCGDDDDIGCFTETPVRFPATLRVVKTVVNNTIAPVGSFGNFAISVTCRTAAGVDETRMATIAAGAAYNWDGAALLAGATCSVTETGTGGASSITIDGVAVTSGVAKALAPLAAGTNSAPVVNTFNPVSVAIGKTINGVETSPGFAYRFAAVCEFAGAALTLPAADSSFTLVGGANKSIGGLPAGSTCTITETARGGALYTRGSVNAGPVVEGVVFAVTVPAGSTGSINVLNDFVDASPVPPIVPTPPGGGGLPSTGTDTAPFMMIAVGLMLAGGLVLVARRRRHTAVR